MYSHSRNIAVKRCFINSERLPRHIVLQIIRIYRRSPGMSCRVIGTLVDPPQHEQTVKTVIRERVPGGKVPTETDGNPGDGKIIPDLPPQSDLVYEATLRLEQLSWPNAKPSEDHYQQSEDMAVAERGIQEMAALIRQRNLQAKVASQGVRKARIEKRVRRIAKEACRGN
jgi:hypothetical protein